MTPEARLLVRHQLRRKTSTPTLSVFSGPFAPALQLWKEWAAPRETVIVPSSECVFEKLAPFWVEKFVSTRNLFDEVVRWLSRQLPDTTEVSLRARLGNMTQYDFDRFREGWPHLADDTAKVVAWILRRNLQAQVTSEAGLATTLIREAFPVDSLRWIHVLAVISPLETLPTILVLHDPQKPLDDLTRAMNLLLYLGNLFPRLPLSVVAMPDVLDQIVYQQTDSRLAAHIREGRIPIIGLTAEEIRDRLAPTAQQPIPETLISTLAELGATPATLESAAQLTALVTPPEDAKAEDRARSFAEKFLFELLEIMPETVGKFALNQSLDFKHGPRNAEADLVSEELRLVIELDGFYYHLNNKVNYRRDRRKDWAYQKHGYIVLRFLSEDMTAETERILSTIREAVAHRSAANPPPTGVSDR